MRKLYFTGGLIGGLFPNLDYASSYIATHAQNNAVCIIHMQP